MDLRDQVPQRGCGSRARWRRRRASGPGPRSQPSAGSSAGRRACADESRPGTGHEVHRDLVPRGLADDGETEVTAGFRCAPLYGPDTTTPEKTASPTQRDDDPAACERLRLVQQDACDHAVARRIRDHGPRSFRPRMLLVSMLTPSSGGHQRRLRTSLDPPLPFRRDPGPGRVTADHADATVPSSTVAETVRRGVAENVKETSRLQERCGRPPRRGSAGVGPRSAAWTAKRGSDAARAASARAPSRSALETAPGSRWPIEALARTRRGPSWPGADASRGPRPRQRPQPGAGRPRDRPDGRRRLDRLDRWTSASKHRLLAGPRPAERGDRRPLREARRTCGPTGGPASIGRRPSRDRGHAGGTSR